MAKSHLQLVTPTEVLRTVPPKRAKNADLRTREHLTLDEVAALIEAAKGNRYGHRDTTMVLLAFRHRLRSSEVCDLRSISTAPCCTSAGSRTAPRAPTQSRAMSYDPCDGSSARARRHLSSLSASVDRRSAGRWHSAPRHRRI
jgi:hypothetical protein